MLTRVGGRSASHQNKIKKSANRQVKKRAHAHLIDEPFALRSPAIEAGHVGGSGSLIDEDKFLRIKGWLFFPQGFAGRGDVAPILLGCVNAFF